MRVRDFLYLLKSTRKGYKSDVTELQWLAASLPNGTMQRYVGDKVSNKDHNSFLCALSFLFIGI